MDRRKENGYDTFSTTLLISPYQNHDALKQIGEEMAQKYIIRNTKHVNPNQYKRYTFLSFF